MKHKIPNSKKVIKRIPHILSVQSHVSYGYVGNRVAVLVLELLKNYVSVINTVLFSNHTGYQHYKGTYCNPTNIEKLFEELNSHSGKFLQNCDAILSGYLGSIEIGDVLLKNIQKMKKKNPNLLYCCDPVIGDVDTGVFVKPGLKEFMKNSAIKQADIITPNIFEASCLSDIDIKCLSDAQAAIEILHLAGVKYVIIKSLINVENNKILTIVSDNKRIEVIETPHIHFATRPSGSGDLLAALLLSHYLQIGDIFTATEKAVNSVFEIIYHTFKSGKRELEITQQATHIISPPTKFKLKAI